MNKEKILQISLIVVIAICAVISIVTLKKSSQTTETEVATDEVSNPSYDIADYNSDKVTDTRTENVSDNDEVNRIAAAIMDGEEYTEAALYEDKSEDEAMDEVIYTIIYDNNHLWFLHMINSNGKVYAQQGGDIESSKIQETGLLPEITEENARLEFNDLVAQYPDAEPVLEQVDKYDYGTEYTISFGDVKYKICVADNDCFSILLE